jgi:DNA-binding NtrC family response regulator
MFPHAKRPASLIVCESAERWAAVLRQMFDAAEVRVCETRSLPQAWERLVEAPESLLVLELTIGSPPAVLEAVNEVDRRFPRSRVIVVAPRGMASYAGLAREAGAVYFTTSPRTLRRAAPLARRHWAAQPNPRGAPTTLVE